MSSLIYSWLKRVWYMGGFDTQFESELVANIGHWYILLLQSNFIKFGGTQLHPYSVHFSNMKTIHWDLHPSSVVLGHLDLCYVNFSLRHHPDGRVKMIWFKFWTVCGISEPWDHNLIITITLFNVSCQDNSTKMSIYNVDFNEA